MKMNITSQRKKSTTPRKGAWLATAGVILLTVSILLSVMLGGCGKKKEEAATSAKKTTVVASDKWVVDYIDGNQGSSGDDPLVNRMLYQHRFTDKWKELKADNFAVSSKEAKKAHLAAVRWEDESGAIHFNPLILIACLEAWQPEALEGIAEATSFKNLISQDEESSKWYASALGQRLIEEYEEFILRDDVFVFTGTADSGLHNSGSAKDGVRYAVKAGITGNRVAWFVRTGEKILTGEPASGKVSAKASAQLTRCGNPARREIIGKPTGKTDETPKPATTKVPTTKPATTKVPTTKPATTKVPTTKPATTATPAKKKDPTKVPQIKETIQGLFDAGKQKSDRVPATKASNPKPTNRVPAPNPKPVVTKVVTTQAPAKAGDPPRGNSTPDKPGGAPAAPASGAPVTSPSGDRVTPGKSDNGGTLSGGVIE